MSNRQMRHTMIKLLAYVHRYFLISMIILYPTCLASKYILMLFGIICILYGAYTFVGYKLKWKHIYCSIQNAYREKMTPDKINWRHVQKKDVYGIFVIFCVLGLFLIICNLIELKC